MCFKHRYNRPDIPVPAPSLSRHGAAIGGIWVFAWIKIIMIHQMLMYCSLSVKINKRETPCKDQGCICLHMFLRVWSAKTRIPPIGAPWLTMPLHGAV